MIKPIVHCGWDPGITDFDVPVEIYCDGAFIYRNPDSDAVKILWINEPREILVAPHAHAKSDWDKYDFILTWNAELLDTLPNAVYFRNDMCWIPDYDEATEKKFGVSTVVGFKMQTEGHRLRHKLWNQRGQITIPKAFYASAHGAPNGHEHGLVLGSSKLPLFDYQFHIAIENVSSRNMISEKLNDACRTKTVPIYWGCPNVEDTYDPRGIIMCDSVGDIIAACNNATPEMYNEMLPYVEENFQRSKNLLRPDGRSRISETIAGLINTMKKDGTNLL